MTRPLASAFAALAILGSTFNSAATADDKATVNMTVTLDGLSKLKFKFRAYDPVSGKALGKTVKVSPPKNKKKPSIGFYPPGETEISFSLPAGDWFLDTIEAEVQKDFNVTRVITASYAAGTFAFHVEPGVTSHLGSYEYGTSLTRLASAMTNDSAPTPARFSCEGKAGTDATAYCDPETVTTGTGGALTLQATSHEVLKRVRPQLDPIWAKTKPDYKQPEDKAPAPNKR